MSDIKMNTERVIAGMMVLLMIVGTAHADLGGSLTVVSAEKTDSTLWDNFLKYDLCITNYDELSENDKELCSFKLSNYGR